MPSSTKDPYLEHFRLRREPFGLIPETQHLYLGTQHGEALAGLQIGIRQRRGLITLIGEVGMGKTTLAHAVIEAMDEKVLVAYTANTTLGFEDMMRPALLDLELTDWVEGKASMLRGLTELLEIANRRGLIVALIVDEAHNLSPEVFEELRLLLNIENREAKLLQLVLTGQPELEDRLSEPELRHVADRVAVRCVLNPLSKKESARYLETRLEGTGAQHDLFSPAALRMIFRAARGVPRSINVLCHNSMLFAYGEGSTRVEARHARTAVRERRGGQLKRLAPRRSRHWSLPLALLASGILVGLLIGLFWFRARDAAGGSTPVRSTPNAPTTVPQSAPSEPEVGSVAAAGDEEDESAPAGESPGPPPTPIEEDLQPGTRTVLVEPGASLFTVLVEVYGSYDSTLLRRVLAANPEIVDPDFLVPGQRLVLPAPASP